MIIRSPEPAVAIPDVPLTELLLTRAASRGEKAALIDGPTGRTLTFRGWAEAVRRTAASLARRGFRKGDVFAIYSPNLPEYAVAFHAVALLGGVNTTISPLYTPLELRQQLIDSGARFIVSVAPCVEKVKEAVDGTDVKEIFVFGQADGATPFHTLGATQDEPPSVTLDCREDLVALPYSSGTTGLPKGVMLTHYNLVANLLQTAAVIDLSEQDTVLGVLPFFHIYGMTVIMNLGLYAGSTIVTMPRFELEQCLEAMQKYRVTFANVVPPIVLAFAKSPLVEKYDLRSLRRVYSGAAPLTDNVARAASARLGCTVGQGYGLTETSPVTHGMRDADGREDCSSVGPPVPNTEAKVIDLTTGADLPANEKGEVCVRGPQIMKGYLNRPDATRAMIDADGWLHTGDIGYVDEAGRFYVVDRLKELIKYKGLQIAPAELEAVLLGHPSISDAAVVPIADEHAGEVPKGFVVLRGMVTPDEIMCYVAERVAPYKKLRALEIIDQIPKSPAGKILRRVLIERERQAGSADGQA
jgi:acyl-CoA synthetase (AMP-forming)/AMP-acid ligase II